MVAEDKAKGATGSQVAADRDAELKAALGQFTLGFLKALMMSGIYPEDHPAVADISEEPFQHLKRLAADANEITFMTTSAMVGDDITVEGVFEEGLPFVGLIQSSMGEHFAKKFTDYFERNRLVSFSVKTRIEREEFQRLVSVFVERRSEEEERGMALTVPFGDMLLERGIVHVTAMSREEVVGGERPLPWRVKMAISRLRKDLKHVPLYSRATQQELARAKTMIIQDITRPLRRPQFLKELLANTDLISVGVTELAEVDVDREIVWGLHPGMLVNISWEMVADLDRASWGEITQAVGNKERRIDDVLRNCLKNIALRLKEVEPKLTKELLHYLFQKEILKYANLPYVLQQELLVEKWTDQFLETADKVLSRFAQLTDPAVYHQYINTFLQVFPELIRRSCIEECKSIAEMVRSHLDTPSDDIPDRQQRAQVALARFSEPAVLDALVAVVDSEDKETRGQALACMAALGDRALGGLFRLLEACEDAPVRRDIASTIERLGDEAHVPLMEWLGARGKEWYVYRNAILMLGNVGFVAAADDVRRFLSHPHPRVREEAVTTLQKLQGEAAVRDIQPLVRDRDKAVVKRAVVTLARLKCRNPFFLQALADLFRGGKDRPEVPDELLLVGLDAVAQIGAFAVDDVDIRDVLVERLESGASVLNKLFKKRRTAQDSEVVRSAICGTLGHVGDAETARSLEPYVKDSSPLVRERASDAMRLIAARCRT